MPDGVTNRTCNGVVNVGHAAFWACRMWNRVQFFPFSVKLCKPLKYVGAPLPYTHSSKNVWKLRPVACSAAAQNCSVVLAAPAY